jgi:hypothetical protein
MSAARLALVPRPHGEGARARLTGIVKPFRPAGADASQQNFVFHVRPYELLATREKSDRA